SPSTLAEVNSSLWEGYQDFIEAVKGQKCQIQKEKQATLGAGHQGHLHWYQSIAPGCRRPNQVSALVSFCPGLEVPKERAWLKPPAAGWRKTGLSLMAPQRQRTSQKGFRKPKTQQEEGGGQRFQNTASASVNEFKPRLPEDFDLLALYTGKGSLYIAWAAGTDHFSALSKPADAGGARAAQLLPPEPTAHAHTRTRSRGSGGGRMSKACTYEGCSETTSQVAKQCKPWMCKKHRNKLYKDKHKKKKSDQALNCGEAAQAGSAGNVKLEESADNILSTVKERTESFGDQPSRPTLLEQVLNQNRLLTKKSRSGAVFTETATTIVSASFGAKTTAVSRNISDLEDEETHSGGEGGSGGARRRGSGGGSMSKTCTYEGCSETTSQVAKQRKPWMCKKHRNKMYKDKYKKKKSDQALNCGGAAQAGSAGNVKLEESADNILSIVKQRTGSFGDRPARPTLLEQVLNQKRLLRLELSKRIGKYN
ncbi:hypothetical protein E2I00_000209, partial [Balaenoptera physalus]